MSSAHEDQRQAITIAIQFLPDVDGYGAVTWRNEDITVIEFIEILDTAGHGYFPFRRELRVFETTDPTTIPMPQGELEERLNKWVKNDRNDLPVVLRSMKENTMETTEYSTAQLKLAPFPLMYSELIREYAALVETESFIAPSEEEIELLLVNNDLVGMRTKAIFSSHMEQLRAVQFYVEAVNSNSTSPLKDVAESLVVSHTRARNLIDFARTNKYLTGRNNQGKAAGFATKEAHDLANTAKQHAALLKKGSK